MLRSIGLLIVTQSTLQFSHNTLNTLVPLALEKSGHSPSLIGLVISALPAGYLAGCTIVVPVIHWLGSKRTLLVLSIGLSLSSLLFLTDDSVVLWASLRAVMGFLIGGLFTLVEAWLHEVTGPRIRGRVAAAYSTGLRLANTGGLALIAAGIPDYILFAASAVGFLLVLAPMALTRQRPSPLSPSRSHATPWSLPPLALLGCATAGLLSTTLLTLAPVYMLQAGFSISMAAMVAIAIQAASLVILWPSGWAADRFDRRWILVGMTLAPGLGSMVALNDEASFLFLIIGISVAGGAAQAHYFQASAYAYDHVERTEMVSASSSLQVVWSIGSIIGPLVASGAMELFGRDGLLFYVAGLSLAFAIATISAALHGKPDHVAILTRHNEP